MTESLRVMSLLLIIFVSMINKSLSSLAHICVSMEDFVCSSQSNTTLIQQDIGDTILLYIFGFNTTKEVLHSEKYNIDISSNFIDTSYIPLADNIDSYIAIIKLPDDITENDTSTNTANYIKVHDATNNNNCPEDTVCKNNNEIYIKENWYSNYHLL
eukprot:258256_1